MENQFNPQEILKISVEVEEAGAKLYGKLEQQTKNEKVKGVWRYLKDQEVEHKKIFSDILNQAGEYIVYDLNPGEYQNYIRAISSEYIFTSGLIEEKTKKGFENDLEAVDFGISIEKESIFVYTSFKEYMKTGRKELIDRVVDQERKHYANLVDLKKTLKK